MAAQVEIHGYTLCPFAWRSRLAAHEKGVSFEWFPADVPEPDPRSTEHNPNKRSPLLRHGDFTVTDSAVIVQYLDEAFQGPSLQPEGAKERALMRLTMIDLGGIVFDGRKELDDEARTKTSAALAKLETKLSDDAPWLGGATPSRADLEIWPFLATLEAKGGLAVDQLPRVARYWERVQARESFRVTKPRPG
jgi:glutathione S-transferase